jgi:predicted CXXCH cytochrome family protein
MPHRLFVLISLCGFAQDAEGPAILRPTNQSSVPAGPLSVVARITGDAQITLDGKPVAAEKRASNVLSANIEVAPGVHELTLGAQRVKFAAVAAGENTPAGFKTFRAHPPKAACETCHVAKAGTWEVKETVTNCFTCHETATFPKKHDHNAEVLKDCGWCHSTHGSAEAAHLKMTKEKACKLCHG